MNGKRRRQGVNSYQLGVTSFFLAKIIIVQLRYVPFYAFLREVAGGRW